MIWKVKIPYKVACFLWLMARQAVLTQDKLIFFCESEAETIFNFSYTVKWPNKFGSSTSSWEGSDGPCQGTSEVLACWNRHSNLSGHRKTWKIVPACIWWSIWKERNQRCYEDKSNTFQKLKMNCLVFYLFLVYSWISQRDREHF